MRTTFDLLILVEFCTSFLKGTWDQSNKLKFKMIFFNHKTNHRVDDVTYVETKFGIQNFVIS